MAPVNRTNNTNNVQRRRTNIRRISLNLSNLPNGNYSMTRSTISTLAIIMAHRRKRAVQAGTSVRTFHDNTSPGYQWLLPGWLCEERQMPLGKIYRYYFDPSGDVYRSQEEVMMKWELCGLIVIQDD